MANGVHLESPSLHFLARNRAIDQAQQRENRKPSAGQSKPGGGKPGKGAKAFILALRKACQTPGKASAPWGSQGLCHVLCKQRRLTGLYEYGRNVTLAFPESKSQKS